MLRTALIAALLAGPAGMAHADADRALQKVQASRVMYDEGVANRDPLLVLAAARLRRTVGLIQSDRTAEGGGSAGDYLAWQDMLDQADAFAAGDELMLGLIEDERATRSKGVTNGPVYNIASLGGKGSDTYRNVPFDGKKYAEVYVEAKGNQDINVYIYDAQNRLVCSDTDVSAIAYCGWRPRESGAFSVKVTNESGAGAEYSLMTN